MGTYWVSFAWKKANGDNGFSAAYVKVLRGKMDLRAVEDVKDKFLADGGYSSLAIIAVSKLED